MSVWWCILFVSVCLSPRLVSPPGAKRLSECHTLTNLLKQQHESGRLIGAVCAAPSVVLAHHHLLKMRADHHKGIHLVCLFVCLYVSCV
jgi:putative intracellular protease/amidase